MTDDLRMFITILFYFQLNLASQSVLEGLNACFDHRGEVYSFIVLFLASIFVRFAWRLAYATDFKNCFIMSLIILRGLGVNKLSPIRSLCPR